LPHSPAPPPRAPRKGRSSSSRAPASTRWKATAAPASLDYIQINSPFLNAAGWNAEVTKMIKAFGAPIDEADAKAIVDYLAKNYGS